MKDVEKLLPSFRWADEIKLSRVADELTLVGKRFYASNKQSSNSEIIGDYLRRLAGNLAGDEGNTPHYLFANAESNTDLLNFLKRFGPITSDPASIRIAPFTDTTTDKGPGIEIRSKQTWETVRKERLTFDAVFALYAELHSEEPDGNKLLTAAAQIQLGASSWVKQFDEEMIAAIKSPSLSEGPRWYWDSSRQSQLQHKVAALRSYVRVDGLQDAKKAEASAHLILCDILNAFPVTLTHFKGAIEVPSENLAFGIRHVLYYLVRCDYLRASPLARCAWKECTMWFKVGPQGSPCCSPEHALKHRQWHYYHEGKGKKVMAKRYKNTKKRSTTGRK